MALTENITTLHRNHQNRNIKQILGHLIDSASNNHQRMVRLQYNKRLEFPDYTSANDRWISIQDYTSENWCDMVQLWKFFNMHIAYVLRSADPATTENIWTDEDGNEVTLKRMGETYIYHLDLHLNEIRNLAK